MTVRSRTQASPASRLAGRIALAVREMYPGYFAMVMATGIISNAVFLVGWRSVSEVLLGVNVIAYPVLLAATLVRVVRFPRQIWTDLTDPVLVFTFFTFVAASDVLGISLYLRGYGLLAAALWTISLVFWAFLSYFSFSVLTFLDTERGADVVHGGWLIAIVGTQSLVLLGTLLAPDFGAAASAVYMLTHSLWGIGLILYGVFLTLFSYRIFFFRLDPAQMHPLFWVVMGASAIGTNAGSTLIMASTRVSFLVALRPFVEGMSLVLWAWSTWLIPLFVVFGVWRHGVCKVPLVYHPMYWSLVFPLGMYTLATYRLSLAAEYALLGTIAHLTIWVALGAWAVTMLGLVRATMRQAVEALTC